MDTLEASDPHTVHLGSRTYPVMLPKLKDPRLKIAATVISVHILGQVGLDFRVSIAQILVAVLSAAIIDAALLFWRKQTIEWPASALLTGAGVGLILRVVGTEHGDWWSMKGWYLFAGVSAISVLSKYAIRPRGVQIFNPNNLGLVLAFLVLGNTVVEPLDFWWGPMSPALALAVIVLMVGGTAVTSQVRMLSMAVTFWITFAAFLGILAYSGHCFTAQWSTKPVCGGSFWWVVVTSPELLVFLFFMITDPKAIPHGRVARVVFAAAVAMLAVLFIAPQQTEFGAKIALLGSLTVLCAARFLVEHRFPEAGSEDDRIRSWVRKITPMRGVILAGSLVAFGGLVVLVGSTARTPVAGSVMEATAVERPVIELPAGSIPTVTVNESARESYAEVDAAEASVIAEDLVIDLIIEADALLARDPRLAEPAAFGLRLLIIQEQITEAETSGQITVATYEFDSMEIVLFSPGGQALPRLGVEASGTILETTYGGSDGVTELSRSESSFGGTFLVAKSDDGHYLIIEEIAAS